MILHHHQHHHHYKAPNWGKLLWPELGLIATALVASGLVELVRRLLP